MNKQQKNYAVAVKVKPTLKYGVKYQSKSFKGIAFAANPTLAKESVIEMILESYKDYDGSSVTRPLITRENITITKCEPYNDFIAKTEFKKCVSKQA
jgi:hypothetical protein